MTLRADLEHILLHTRELWPSVRRKRIFVTGGTGFFGRWLLESFAYANRKLDLEAGIVVLSRNPELFAATAPHLASDPALSLVRGDVRTLRSSTVFGEFDFVVHAATEASAKLNAENPELMFSTIVAGTRAALEFSIATGARRFLFTSSGAVYGTQPSEVTHVPETYTGGPDCTDPASAYAEGKRAAEILCACFHKQCGIEPIIARCFAFVGPFLPLDSHFAIGNFIRDALAGKPIRILGDGTPHRSYLYSADLAIWLWTMLFRGKAMRPYNVGSSEDMTILQVAKAVRDAIAPHLEVEVAQKPQPKARESRYVPDNSRGKCELGLDERVTISESIRRTAEAAITP